MEIHRLITGLLSVNTWFIPAGDNNLLVIDPGGDPDRIISHISDLSVHLFCILLTHTHIDHLGALPSLLEVFPGTPVGVHQAESRFLGPGSRKKHQEMLSHIGMAELVPGFFEDLRPADFFLEDGQEPELPGGRKIAGWRVIHTPGHSPGSICLYNEEDSTLVSGDTLFYSGIGRTDLPGGSFPEIYRSLSGLFELPPDTRVLPGHGPETTIGREHPVALDGF
ncbi:MBL fold metallo-hydrolase [Brucepastera parasyntrophica]|uniref:MBL fold metallo-hydrolase n=1 Tax=Brucepastera parasyntrophica TaxID=2880008 RepID=UPI00210D78E6|nr:MBL fold metallo-hydrolase [Brucepastera parasyntrophica]ULQ60924.1 MBL fold metallo-hydrolase [Brucepastera parasyntrophica]